MEQGVQKHWESIYADRSADEMSWRQQQASMSLLFIEEAFDLLGDIDRARPVRIVDMGGGASPLVDGLLELGGVEVCVVDIADAGMAIARERLGRRAAEVRWIVADAAGSLPEIDNDWADIWHDRAALHFLTDDADRRAYAANVARILRPGGAAVIATFGPDGPPSCSGLPVLRQDGASIARSLGMAPEGAARFRLVRSAPEQHRTPWGAAQAFTWALLQREK